MTKFLILLIGLCVIAFIIITISGTFKAESNNQAVIAEQNTERIRLEEQTKREAAQLRTEESSKMINSLTLIFGPIILIFLGVFVLIIADSRLTKNRIYECRELARLDRLRIREDQHLLAMNQRFELELKHRECNLLLPKTINKEGELIGYEYQSVN